MYISIPLSPFIAMFHFLTRPPANETRSHVTFRIDLTNSTGEYPRDKEEKPIQYCQNIEDVENGANGANVASGDEKNGGEQLVMPHINVTTSEIGSFEHLIVGTKSPILGATNSRQKVFTGTKKHPELWFLASMFAPVVVLSALSFLPFYVYTLDYRNKQDPSSSDEATIKDATHQGVMVTIFTLSVWAFVILCTCVGCRNKWKYFDFEKTEVPKGIFENNNDPHFEVIDWGGVEGPLKQLMHASLYAYLIKEIELPRPIRTVKILSYNKSGCLASVCYAAALVIFVGFLVLFAMAFMRWTLDQILFMWLSLCIFSIIPSALLSIGVFYKSVNLQLEVEVMTYVQGRVERMQTLTFHTKYYSSEISGKWLSSDVYEI